jgi:hypothetical protein
VGWTLLTEPQCDGSGRRGNADARRSRGTERSNPFRSSEESRANLDRWVGFPVPQPEPTAAKPPEGEARVKLPSAVDQGDRGIEVFAEITECVGSAAKDIGIVPGDPKCLPSKIDAFVGVRRRASRDPVFGCVQHLSLKLVATIAQSRNSRACGARVQ